MPSTASELARRLAANAEAVCRHYLSNGYRQGRYWLVGDVGNTPGSSLYVRLHGPEAGPGAAGKWTDAATGEHGDLPGPDRRQPQDRCYARRPRRGPTVLAPPGAGGRAGPVASTGWIARSGTAPICCVPIDRRHDCRDVSAGTRHNGFAGLRGPSLPSALLLPPGWRGFGRRAHRSAGARGSHQRSRRHDDRGAPHLARSVRPHEGAGRNAKTRDGQSPRQRGAVRDSVLDVMAAGEGIETILSLRSVMPALPMVAALSANHLAALVLPCDDAPPIHRAGQRPGRTPRGGNVLTERAHEVAGSRR